MTKTKINLLQASGGPKIPKVKRPLFGSSFFTLLFVAILLIFEVAFLATFYKRIAHKIFVTEKYHSDLNAEMSSLQRDLVKLKALEQADPKIRVSVADSLTTSNDALIKLLKSLSQALPSMTWMNQITQQSDRFMIEGYAMTHKKISEFLTKLEATKKFKAVTLVKLEQVKHNKRSLKKFLISCQASQL